MGGGIDSDGDIVRKPAGLAHAEFILGALERFGGYTLETLLAEDARLIGMLNIEARGRREEVDIDG